jgi:hypothetical protein
MPDPDPAVTAVFARADRALAASGHRVTVTTADQATPLSPWSLAWSWSEWTGRHDLLIRRHVDGDDVAFPWEDAEPAGRLATLPQLPELVSRVAAAARKAGQDAEPEEVGRVGRDVAGAIGMLLPPGPEKEGWRADG